MMAQTVLYSKRVLIGNELVPATVNIQNGRIEAIVPGVHTKDAEDLDNAVMMPGLIDSHVHINEPGRTEWEGFDTATRAAAAGGITTLIDMPLNSSPVTTDASALNAKMNAAKNGIHVHCGFYGGIIPGNEGQLQELIDGGVFGIKAFLTHSGIDEFPNVTEQDLRKGIPILKKNNIPLLVHAELESPHSDQGLLDKNPGSYMAYLKSRPKSWEDNAIQLMIQLCREFKNRTHIVHLSSDQSIQNLKDAIGESLPISVETCPHYLFFNAEEIPDGHTQYKCAPPIREKANNDHLWEAVRDGLISMIVTDHSPALPAIKELESGNLKKAWGGIAGLQFSLPSIWTKAKERGFTVSDVARLMSSNVARFLGLQNRKGKIEKGFDADLIVWHPERTFLVTKKSIEFRHKITPYENHTLSGMVERTYVEGNKVFDNGKITMLNRGKILKRNE